MTMNSIVATLSMPSGPINDLQPALSCCSTLAECADEMTTPSYEPLYNESTQIVPELYHGEEREIPSDFSCKVSGSTPAEATPLMDRDPLHSLSSEWSSHDVLSHPKVNEASCFVSDYFDFPPITSHFVSDIDTPTTTTAPTTKADAPKSPPSGKTSASLDVDTSPKSNVIDSPPSSLTESNPEPPPAGESFSLVDVSVSDDASPSEPSVSSESSPCPKPEKSDSYDLFPLPKRPKNFRPAVPFEVVVVDQYSFYYKYPPGKEPKVVPKKMDPLSTKYPLASRPLPLKTPTSNSPIKRPLKPAPMIVRKWNKLMDRLTRTRKEVRSSDKSAKTK